MVVAMYSTILTLLSHLVNRLVNFCLICMNINIYQSTQIVLFMSLFLLLILFAEIVSEVQLKKFRVFLQDYAQQLNDIEHALGESVSDAWDMTLDPISLQVCSSWLLECILVLKKLHTS